MLRNASSRWRELRLEAARQADSRNRHSCPVLFGRSGNSASYKTVLTICTVSFTRYGCFRQRTEYLRNRRAQHVDMT